MFTCDQRLVHVVEQEKVQVGGMQLPHAALLHPSISGATNKISGSGRRRARIKDCPPACRNQDSGSESKIHPHASFNQPLISQTRTSSHKNVWKRHFSASTSVSLWLDLQLDDHKMFWHQKSENASLSSYCEAIWGFRVRFRCQRGKTKYS